MITTALSWSLEAEADTANGRKTVTESMTVTIEGTNLQSLISNNGYTTNNVTFKLSGDNSMNYNGSNSYISMGTVSKSNKNFSIALTVPANYTIESINSASVRAVGYTSAAWDNISLTVDGGNKTNIRTISVNPQNSDNNYTTVTSSNISSKSNVGLTFISSANNKNIYIRKVVIELAVSTFYDYSAIALPNNNAYGNTSAEVTSENITGTLSDVPVSTTATFKATPTTGYKFQGWGTTSNAISYESTSTPYNVTINNSTPGSTASKTLYAIFYPYFQFSANAESSNIGYGSAEVTIADAEKLGETPESTTSSTTATFTATVTGEECVFMGWYDNDDYAGDPLSTDLTYNTTITNADKGTNKNLTLYALFKKQNSKKDNIIDWNDGIATSTDLLLPIDLSTYAVSEADGLAITYSSSDENIATVENGMLYPHAIGDFRLIASTEENEEYNEARVELPFTVTKVPTVITWNQELPILFDRDSEGILLTATLADVRGNAITGLTYSVKEGTAVDIQNGTVYARSGGSAIVAATYSGTEVYASASSVEKTINVKSYQVSPLWVGENMASGMYMVNVGSQKFFNGGNATLQDTPTTTWNISGNTKFKASNDYIIRYQTAGWNVENKTTGTGQRDEFTVTNQGNYRYTIYTSYFGDHYFGQTDNKIADLGSVNDNSLWVFVSLAQYSFRTQIAPAAVENYLYNSDYAEVTGPLRDNLAAAVLTTSDFAGANSRIAALEQAFDDYIAAIATINTFESEYAANTPDAVNPVNDIAAARTALESATSSAEIATAVAHLRAFDVITITKQPAALVSLHGGAVSAGIVATANGTIAYVSDDAEVLTITTDGITITPVAEGSTTITLSTETSATHYAAMPVQTIAVSVSDALVLSNATVASYTPGEYGTVVIERTLKVGYNSIAIPFDVALSALNADWAAQLSIVAYNSKDGYSLYFHKFTEGTLNANEPYIIHVTAQKENPQFSDVTVAAAVETIKQATGGVNADGYNYADWSMHSNYTPGFDMQGKYGVVNADGCLKVGGVGSTLAAFGAYINYDTAAPSNQKVATRFVSDDELAAIIEQIETGAFEDTTIIYDLSGRRTSTSANGVKIEVSTNGKSRKVLR